MAALIVSEWFNSTNIAVWVTALATLAYRTDFIAVCGAPRSGLCRNALEKFSSKRIRPYVGMQNWDLWKDAGAKGHLNCLTLINVGNVPASNVHVHIETFDHSGTIEKATSAEAGFVLFPNQAYTVQLATALLKK